MSRSARRPGPRSDLAAIGFCLPALALFVLAFAAPLGGLLRLSFNAGGGGQGFGVGAGGFYEPGTWTLAAYRELAASAYFKDVLGFTLGFGLGVALLCVAIGYPLALAIARLSSRWRVLALVIVVLPKLANVLVVVYGLKLLLANAGPVNDLLLWLGLVESPVRLLNNLVGTVIGKVYLILPYTVLVLVLGLMRIDDDLLDAAAGLGATPWARFTRVIWPLSRPALATAFVVSLVFGVGAFVSPYLMGSPDQITISVDVQRQTFENLDWPQGAAESAVMLAVCIAALAVAGGVQAVMRWRGGR